MASSTLSSLSAFVKVRYPQRKIENLVAYEKPTINAFKRSAKLTGSSTYIPMQYDVGQGEGSTLDVAAASDTAGGATNGVVFQVPRAKRYAVCTIDVETMLAMGNDEGAFFRARERQIEERLEGLGQQIEMALWSTGSGSRGTISTEPDGSVATVTLVNSADAIKFHKNQRVDFYSDSSGAPTTIRAGGPYVVSKVDEDTGVITFTGNLNVAVALGDHLVQTGDLDLQIKGIPAWIPTVTPTSTAFMGVDRTVAPQKLAGHRQSWLGSIEETVKRLDAKVRRVSPGRPKTLWVSFANFARLEIELGARGMRTEDGGKGTFGRSSLMMSTPGGGVTVKCGPYVPEGAGWLLDNDSFEIMTLGPAPHLAQEDGLAAMRLPANTASNGGDAIEIRWRYFAQLFCNTPYNNGVALFA